MFYYDRLKSIREDKDIPQKVAAIDLGLKQQQLARYELGQNIMPVTRLYDFCIYYGVSADYILGLPKGLKYIER